MCARVMSSLRDRKLKAPIPGNRLNKISGKSEFCFLFRDEHVEGQRALKAAAERVALYQRDRDQWQMKSDRHLIGDVDAVVRIVAQRIDVARTNALDEKIEIAAKIVDAGNTRATDKIFDRRGLARRQVGEHALQHAPHGNQLLQQRGREARRPRRLHEAPDAFFA